MSGRATSSDYPYDLNRDAEEHSADYKTDNPYIKAIEYGAGLKASTSKDITGRLATFEDLAPFGVTTSSTSNGSITSNVLKQINGSNAVWTLGAASSSSRVWIVIGFTGSLSDDYYSTGVAVRPVIEILASEL